MDHFTAQQLADYLKEHKPILLDVREPWEYAICHLQESRLLPMREIPQQLANLDRNAETVVICHHGIRSRAVCNYLEQYGFEQLINLEGGMDAWARQVDPQMAIY